MINSPITDSFSSTAPNFMFPAIPHDTSTLIIRNARIPPQTDPSIYLTALFYDPNSGVKKIKYYESIKNYLNEQNSIKILDPSKINGDGAINFNLNQEELTELNKMMFFKP
ncbi:658_t:CDS:2, partial [Dentiscutata erythropus]